jgi:putative oxidoreductase
MTNVQPVERASTRKGRTIVVWILQILAAAAFLGAGGGKLAGVPPMVAMFEKIGVGQWFRYVTGFFEMIGAIGLFIPRLSMFAALLLACVMVGAIISHLTVLGGSPLAPIVLLLLTLAIAWLRSRERESAH